MNNETSPNNKTSKEQEAGAFWLRKSKAGATYLSGYVLNEDKEKVQLVVFKNSFKQEGDPSPDYRVYFSENKATNASQTKAVKNNTPADSADQPSSDEDEIPF